MERHSAVIVSLHSPREKVWGILLSVEMSGVTIRGIDLNSFDDWSREVARGETTMALSTVFFPMHRVERILMDEGAPGIQSLTDVFESRVGKDVWSWLSVSRPSGREESGEETSPV